MNLSIVIPYRNGGPSLDRLIKTLPPGPRVIVVDDVSETPPNPALASERVRIVRLEERGYFSGAVNRGIVEAGRSDVLVLNQDIWFADGDGWLERALAWGGQYAIAGDGVVNRAWPKGYVQGTFMWMARKALDSVGLLSERDWPLWGATCEWQLRACRKGFRALPLPRLDWFRHERSGEFGASIKAALREGRGRHSWLIRTPPMISVVIPTYQHGRYLADAVHSLIGGETCLGPHPGQTFQGFEIVIVDDASPDNTREVALSLADPWQAIRYIRRETNGGTAAAANTGCEAARGRFIQRMDGDDMLEPEALETAYRIVEQNPTLVPYYDQMIVKDGERVRAWQLRDYNFETLLHKNHVPAGKMFSRVGWKAAGGYPKHFADGRDDWAFAVALGIAGYCGVRVPRPLYLYRREGQNRTLTNTTPDRWRAFAAKMRATFPQIYKGERPMGCCGSRATTVKVSGGRTTVMATAKGGAIGDYELALVEYTGDNWGLVSWWGEATKTRYQFSKRAKRGYVKAPDVSGILDSMENGRHAFRMVPKPKPVAVAAMKDRHIEVEVEEPEPMQVADGEAHNVSEMTVKQVKEFAADMSIPSHVLVGMMEAERAGQARKGVLAALNEALGV
jgi:glycosyltransferase involved in cell wall biosynthesis